MNSYARCKLCGLKLGRNPGKEKDLFCCTGCSMVYSMIAEAEGAESESFDFKKSDIFKRCVAAGVIPDPDAGEEQSFSGDYEGEPDAGDITLENLPENHLICNFNVSDMWCSACAWIIEDALLKSPGVIKASCNFSTDRARVIYDPVQTSPDTIIEKVLKLGYRSSHDEDSEKDKEHRHEFIRISVSGLLTMNVMMLSWALYTGFFSFLPQESAMKISWPVFIMATIVFVYGGWNIHRRAKSGLLSGSPGMETLISMGSSFAYAYSVYEFFRGSIHLYFDTSSMLIVLVLLGKMLERSARDRILKDLDGFFSLMPGKVRICQSENSRGKYVAAAQLSPGDLFRVNVGEIAAADGVVEGGTAVIDESSLTGEPRPGTIKKGDSIKSGARVLEGEVVVLAQKTGENSVLGQMMSVMEETLAGKTPAIKRLDRMLRWFVPMVSILALLTCCGALMAGISFGTALTRAVTVMVISCPCALGIAIPLALVAGVSAAGKQGLLIRNYEAFEACGKWDHIVFDKTGTVTSGIWKLLRVSCPSDISQDMLVAIACGLEKESDHYIARTLRHYAAKKKIVPLKVNGIQEEPRGITGVLEGRKVAVGSLDFVKNHMDENNSSGMHGDEQWLSMRNPGDRKGENYHAVSRVFVGISGKIAGVLMFGDTVRPGMKNLMGSLKKMGAAVHMISGDSSLVTREVAEELGINLFKGDMLPAQKSSYVTKLKQQGKSIVMIGDGVNDAPAMACADLAVSVHNGFDPGREVAHVTLMKGDPRQLTELLSVALRVNKKVRQNLWLSLVYNAISIPVAMTGFLNPVVAAGAMLLSSLSVTGNTLILARSMERTNHAFQIPLLS